MRSAGSVCAAASVLVVLCASIGNSQARPTSSYRYPSPSLPPPSPSAYLSSPPAYASAYLSSPPAYAAPYAAPYATPSSLSPSSPSPPAYGSPPPRSSSSRKPCDPIYFASYIDNSGYGSAPDGNYKQSCADITYSFSTDVLTASCSSNATPEDTTAYKNSTLHGACQCSTNIANIEGNLQCVPESALVPSAPASDTCSPLLVLYTSKEDNTGGTAPDGSYKMYCNNIDYDCETDTVKASCNNGYSYTNTSYTGATECIHDLEPVYGTLYCQTPYA